MVHVMVHVKNGTPADPNNQSTFGWQKYIQNISELSAALPSETRLLDSGAHLVASLYFIYEAGAYFIILHPVTIQKPMQPLPSFDILQRSYVQLTAGYDIPPCPANLNTLTDNFTKVYGAIRLQKPTRCCALILFSAAASRHQLWRKIIICIILIVAKVGKTMQIKSTHLGMIYTTYQNGDDWGDGLWHCFTKHCIFSIFFTYPFPETAMALSSKGGAINRLSHSLPASNRGSPGMFGLTIRTTIIDS